MDLATVLNRATHLGIVNLWPSPFGVERLRREDKGVQEMNIWIQEVSLTCLLVTLNIVTEILSK